MNIEEITLIEPPTHIVAQVNNYISKNNLSEYEKDIYYHFNMGEWRVNLAKTKNSMINYDFNDLVTNFKANTKEKDGESQKQFKERQKQETELLRNAFLNLHEEFRAYVIEQLTPIVKDMQYDDLFQLFQSTWDNAPFKLNYLLEDMFLFFGDKSVMQNVVGDSGSFKSTRSMIEFNSLPSVLRIDDATIAGISRDCQTKGIHYLDNTVVYYNDVGDSSQMQANFKECHQTIYKKLFSEGEVSRNIATKNSDKTLKLNLRTPHGFKIKFNSVKPIFNDDDGQTKARTITISLPAITKEEAIEMVRSGRFGSDIWCSKDPRIFKDVFEVYYKTRTFKEFDNDFRAELTERCIEDNNDESNMHKVAEILYVHQEMAKLYGIEKYKEKYYNRVIINNSMKDLELKLYDTIKEGLNLTLSKRGEVHINENLNEYEIARTRSASVHKNEYDYDSFTIRAVKGIRRDFIEKNKAKIGELLRLMEEHDLCKKIGTHKTYNVYVLLEK